VFSFTAIIRGGLGLHLEGTANKVNAAKLDLILKVRSFLPPYPLFFFFFFFVEFCFRLIYSLPVLFITQIIAINPFIWIAATTFAKISILCFYVSIFERDYIRISSLIVGSIALSFCVAFVLASLLYCRPFACIWDKTIDGKCANVVANEISSAAINMALDLAIAMIPLPGIWALQLPARKKIEMGIMFSFGLA
jgi:hypothetical protein